MASLSGARECALTAEPTLRAYQRPPSAQALPSHSAHPQFARSTPSQARLSPVLHNLRSAARVVFIRGHALCDDARRKLSVIPVWGPILNHTPHQSVVQLQARVPEYFSASEITTRRSLEPRCSHIQHYPDAGHGATPADMFALSLLFRAPEVNPINRKAQSIPCLNPFNLYGRVFFFAWFGFMIAFWSW